MSELKRLSVNVNQPTSDRLEALAARHGQNTTEAVRRAVAVAHWLDEAIAAGATVVVRRPDGTEQEMVFL